jgi:hypothetical protein
LVCLLALTLVGCSAPAQNLKQPSAAESSSQGAGHDRATTPTAALSPQPVTSPVDLKPVTTPPEATVAMVDPKLADAGSKYSVVFVPYGDGPGTGSGGRLVIKVSESRPATDVVKPYAFAGRNVLADSSKLAAGSRITKGGTYSGTLVLVQKGGLLVPQLIEATKK